MHTADPESLGLSGAGLARITAALQAHVDAGRVAGVVAAIARRGHLAYLACLGLADREAGVPMRPGTICRIRSLTKPVTAVAVLILCEEGRLSLDDPVARHIPSFADVRVFVRERAGGIETVPAAPMTIRHLLTHTAGLVYPDAQGSPVERLAWQSECEDTRAHPRQTLAEWAPRLARLPLAFQPGSAWLYSVAHDLLGRVVEVASGLAFDRFLEERIFRPLAMADTGFWVPGEKIGRLAALYTRGEDGQLVLLDPPQGEFAQPPSFLSGGSGLVSTVPDYLRFAEMLQSGGELEGVRILRRESVAEMARDQLPPGVAFGFGAPAPGYGFGLGVRVRTGPGSGPGLVGEFGWSGHAGTEFWVDPQEALVGVIMPQLAPYSTLSRFLAEEFKVLAYQALE